jgi:cell volume regulation protein A
LILLARPLSVYISLFLFKISNRKKLFVSWVGLRGAVPIVLATYPLTAGVANANVIFDLVFFISITSILLQGTTLPVVAKWLRLTLPAEVKKATSLDKDLNPKIKSIMTTVIIEPSCPCLGKALVTLQLGSSNAVTAIQRNGRFITPDGFTKIQVGDELSIMSDDLASLIRVKNILGINA